MIFSVCVCENKHAFCTCGISKHSWRNNTPKWWIQEIQDFCMHSTFPTQKLWIFKTKANLLTITYQQYLIIQLSFIFKVHPYTLLHMIFRVTLWVAGTENYLHPLCSYWFLHFKRYWTWEGQESKKNVFPVHKTWRKKMVKNQNRTDQPKNHSVSPPDIPCYYLVVQVSNISSMNSIKPI